MANAKKTFKVSKEDVEKSNKDLEIKRQKDLMIDVIWKFLQEFGIEEAKMFLQINSVTIQQALQNKMMQATVKELGLHKMLAEGKDKERFEKFLKLIGKEKVAVAKGMLENLSDAIDNFVKAENIDRKIKELKPEWNR